MKSHPIKINPENPKLGSADLLSLYLGAISSASSSRLNNKPRL